MCHLEINLTFSSSLFFKGMADFREVFAKAKHIAIITGAGVSAESGVPTFRGAGGYWRKWQAQVCATDPFSPQDAKYCYLIAFKCNSTHIYS